MIFDSSQMLASQNTLTSAYWRVTQLTLPITIGDNNFGSCCVSKDKSTIIVSSSVAEALCILRKDVDDRWSIVQTITVGANGFGTSAALSDDGSIIIVGAPSYSPQGGIYKYTASGSPVSWSGGIVTGPASPLSLSSIGYTVDVNGDGSVAWASAGGSGALFPTSGRYYRYNLSLGTISTLTGSGDGWGRSVSYSRTGDRLVVSRVGNTGIVPRIEIYTTPGGVPSLEQTVAESGGSTNWFRYRFSINDAGDTIAGDGYMYRRIGSWSKYTIPMYTGNDWVYTVTNSNSYGTCARVNQARVPTLAFQYAVSQIGAADDDSIVAFAYSPTPPAGASTSSFIIAEQITP